MNSPLKRLKVLALIPLPLLLLELFKFGVSYGVVLLWCCFTYIVVTLVNELAKAAEELQRLRETVDSKFDRES